MVLWNRYLSATPIIPQLALDLPVANIR